MIRLAIIGASAGGITAIQRIFENITSPLPFPIVVVLHIHKDTKFTLPLIFGQVYKGPLIEAGDKTEMEPGGAYFATPDYHLLIENEKTLALTQEPPVNYSRPSIDVTFESAAYSMGNGVCGILLTGASADGAAGLKAIQDQGGYTIVQDPDSSEAPIMPLSALQIMDPDGILNLKEIGQKLSSFGSRNDIAKK